MLAPSLISPFVGRIMDWYKKKEGKTYTPETDPGVLSVRQIYAYYKAYGIKTIVMGASFRSIGEIEALAGCDRLTISPELLKELQADNGEMPRKLDPQKAASQAPAKIAMDEKTFRLMCNMGCDDDGNAGGGHPQVRRRPADFARDDLAPREASRVEGTPRAWDESGTPARPMPAALDAQGH